MILTLLIGLFCLFIGYCLGEHRGYERFRRNFIKMINVDNEAALRSPMYRTGQAFSVPITHD